MPDASATSVQGSPVDVPGCIDCGRPCSATPARPCFCPCHRQETTTEYEVKCPADGRLRGRSGDFLSALRIAEWRDKDCGKCHPEDGKHMVVSRSCTPWRAAPHPADCPCEGCYEGWGDRD